LQFDFEEGRRILADARTEQQAVDDREDAGVQTDPQGEGDDVAAVSSGWRANSRAA